MTQPGAHPGDQGLPPFPVAGVVGRPLKRPDALFADCGYDHDKYRRPCGNAASVR
ncbi:hypothetical protein [Streptomyces panaciradicis]|uniref:hypothetical protein n=1 Tax=Streptomyces panaciradicis TaxID=1470261 RepID=UPI003557642B